MADLRAIGDPLPVPSTTFQHLADLDIKGLFHHGHSAKFCGLYTQHFATAIGEIDPMVKRSVNQVVATALKFYMGDRWNNSTLGKAAGVAPNTIANALKPDKRVVADSGKEPSIKLTELALIADALGLTVIDLLTDHTAEERAQVLRDRAADHYRQTGMLPSWAPDAPSPDPHRKQVGTNG